MSRGEFAKTIKTKHPDYASWDDGELVDLFLEKYPVYRDRVSEGFFKEVGKAVEKRGEEFLTAATADQGFGHTLLQTGGAVAGTIGDIAMEGLAAGARAVTPVAAREAALGAGKKAAMTILDTEVGKAGIAAAQSSMEDYSAWAEANPIYARDLEAVVNIASLLPMERAGGAALRTGESLISAVPGSFSRGLEAAGVGASAAGKAVTRGASAALEKAKAAPVVGGAVRTGADVARIASDTGAGAVGFISTVPERIGATAAAKKASAEAMSLELPSVRQAAKFGVKPRDARNVIQATPEERDVFRAMRDAAKAAEAGEDANPADVAGAVLRKRIEDAEALRARLGEDVGKAAASIAGTVNTAGTDVLEALRKVKGLESLSVGTDGLDFSKTTLSTKMSKGDRKTISDLYAQVAAETDPAQLHRIRQELFEALGGRKKANVVLTDTQEQGIEAIRKGLADSIERVSRNYKKANQAYAKIAEPIKNLRKFYSGLADKSPDILDERSGLLLRRFTSNIPSGQNLKNAIGEIDAILAKSGNPSNIDLKRLQEFQNLLEANYDVVKPTGFAGQVSLGIDKSLGGLAYAAIQKVAGQVDPKDARRKVIDDLLDGIEREAAPPVTKPSPKGSAVAAPQGKAAPSVQPLMEEARKYKTADEFVKSIPTGDEGSINMLGTKTGKPVTLRAFHGTTENFEDFKIPETGVHYSGKGVYFTPNESHAERFGGNVKQVVLELKNPFVKYLPEGNIDQQFNELAREMKENGYDSIIVRLRDVDTETGKLEADWINEIVVFSTDTIKTESQLRDIWNEAHGKKP